MKRIANKGKLLPFLAIMAMIIVLSAALTTFRDAEAADSTIVNGDFETGDLSGWTVSGLGAHVEALGAYNFVPPIPVPEGRCFALLSTGPGEINLASLVYC
jgi:hypothetical protein